MPSCTSCLADWKTGYDYYNEPHKWEVPLVTSDTVKNFYTNHPKMVPVTRVFGGIVLGVAKIVADPLISLVGIVVFPILAIARKDSNYMRACALSAIHVVALAAIGLLLAYKASTLYICITAISFGVSRIVFQYLKLFGDPKKYNPTYPEQFLDQTSVYLTEKFKDCGKAAT